MSMLRNARNLMVGIRQYKNWIELGKSVTRGEQPSTVIFRNGVRIDSPRNNPLLDIVYEVFFRKVYNPVRLAVEPEDIVVDLGANVGVFSLFAAQRTRNTIHAIEPFPENVEFLNRNFKANGLQNAVSHRLAITDHVGSAKLFLTEITGGHLLFDHDISGPLREYIEVPAVTLKEFMDDNELGHIDYLKVDCEGSEGAILSSTPEEYLRRIKKIGMEFHDNVSRPDHAGLQALLNKAGFATWLNWNGRYPFGYLYAVRT
jgi:FkbM family methyltransferase